MLLFDKKATSKYFITVSALLVLFYGVYSFYLNVHFFRNFKLYYFNSYFSLLEYRLENLRSLPSMAYGFFSGEVEYVNGENGKAGSIPVLTYHGIVARNVSEETHQGEGMDVSLGQFKDQMFALKKAGWNTVSLQDFYLFKQGKKELPEKSFLLTFDDGRKDSYYPADPILRALDFKASMFIITKFSELDKSNYYLTLDELAKMQESGRWEIESHGYDDHQHIPIDREGTLSFFLTNKKWLEDKSRLETDQEFRERIFNDYLRSKNYIEKNLDKEVISFAFPFGEFGEASDNIPGGSLSDTLLLAENLYKITFHQHARGEYFRANYPENGKSIFRVKRITVSPAWSGADLILRMEQSLQKELPFEDNFETDKGWLNTGWGDVVIDGGMQISAKQDGTGSVAILDGTGGFENYELRSDVIWNSGRNIYIWARFKDEKNYTSCNFAKNLVHIEEVLDGQFRVVKGEEKTFNFPEAGKEFNIGIRVKERNVDCLLNGESIVSTQFLSPDLEKGGIGFKTWDPSFNNSSLIVKRITITPIEEAI